jgi:hypothetical protein
MREGRSEKEIMSRVQLVAETCEYGLGAEKGGLMNAHPESKTFGWLVVSPRNCLLNLLFATGEHLAGVLCWPCAGQVRSTAWLSLERSSKRQQWPRLSQREELGRRQRLCHPLAT